MNIAIVTGASSGMGKWFAIYAPFYFQDIDEVWLIGRNMSRLMKTSRYIKKQTKVFAIDISKENEQLLLKNAIITENPDIKLLVNCAGLGYIGDFSSISMTDNLNMIDVNCRALTQLVHMCVDYMIPDSRIINLASAAAFLPQPEFAVYAATKSYVLSFSRALSKELKKNKIYVTAVCPGCVKTPFFNTAEKYSKMKKYKKIFMAADRRVVQKALWDSRKKIDTSVYGFPIKLFEILSKVIPHKIILSFF